jgi:hypothetical protein
VCDNDSNSTPDELLRLLPRSANQMGGTNFTLALQLIQKQLKSSWDNDRYSSHFRHRTCTNSWKELQWSFFSRMENARSRIGLFKSYVYRLQEEGKVAFRICILANYITVNHWPSTLCHLAVTKDRKFCVEWLQSPQKSTITLLQIHLVPLVPTLAPFTML